MQSCSIIAYGVTIVENRVKNRWFKIAMKSLDEIFERSRMSKKGHIVQVFSMFSHSKFGIVKMIFDVECPNVIVQF